MELNSTDESHNFSKHMDTRNEWTWLESEDSIPLKVRLAGTDLVRRIPFQSGGDLEELHRIIANRFVLDFPLRLIYNDENQSIPIDSDEVWEQLVLKARNQRPFGYIAMNIQVKLQIDLR